MATTAACLTPRPVLNCVLPATEDDPLNRNTTLTAIIFLTTTVVAYELLHRHGESPLPSDSLRDSVSGPVSNPVSQPSHLTPGARSAEPAPLPRTSAADPLEDSLLTESVFGLTVRRDRACTIEIRHVTDARTGDIAEAYVCTPNAPPLADPYETWDESTLASLAYGDAHAAEVLGLRHVVSRDPLKEAMGLALLYRSVALSGDLEPFRKAIGVRYAYREINGEPHLDNLKQQLVFSRIAQIMGDRRFDTDEIRGALRNTEIPVEEIDAIEAGVLKIVDSMAAIETEFTGHSSIGEALENA